MSKRHHLECGCRPASVKRHGHRPACVYFDMTRYVSRRRRAQFARSWQDRMSSMDHIRAVILTP